MFNFLRRKKKPVKLIWDEFSTLCWCPYHNTIIGYVDYELRIKTIKSDKPEEEIAIRLKELVPVDDVKGVLFVLTRGYSDTGIESYWRGELERMHKIDVPHTRWNGKEIVFD